MADPTIAVFTKNRTNPAYEGARLGADRVAAAHGIRTVHYVPETPDDVAQQIELIGRAITDRPSAIVFVPVHETAVNKAILQINAAGIPLINLIVATTAGERVTFVGSDDAALATSITRHLAKRLRNRGRVVVLEGSPASPTSRVRHAGILNGIAMSRPLAVAASVRGDYQRTVAAGAMAKLLAGGLEFDGVIAANDTMALGALDVLEENGLSRPVVGINAIPEAIAAIREGRMLATADFDAMKMACVATEAAVRHLRGEQIPASIMLPVQVVDASNCAFWDRPYSERECPAWDSIV
ncbi:MAG: sugar ABC transporter substrate-binding protein [Burkholderiales bacterium]